MSIWGKCVRRLPSPSFARHLPIMLWWAIRVLTGLHSWLRTLSDVWLNHSCLFKTGISHFISNRLCHWSFSFFAVLLQIPYWVFQDEISALPKLLTNLSILCLSSAQQTHVNQVTGKRHDVSLFSTRKRRARESSVEYLERQDWRRSLLSGYRVVTLVLSVSYV